MTSQVVRKHERVGRVVLWLRAVCGGVVFGHERINSRMNFEWSWTYEHVRTGVGFGAERAWRWGAGSFMQVKELIEEETTGQGNIRE